MLRLPEYPFKVKTTIDINTIFAWFCLVFFGRHRNETILNLD